MTNQKHLEHVIFKTKFGTGDSDRHGITLFALALSIGAKRVLELGVRTGNTTLPFLMAAQETGGMVYSVDLDPTTFVCPADLKVYWNFTQQDAHAWLHKACAEQQKFDLIYIDDWHSYEHVKKELEYAEQMTSPSGLIVLHDLMYTDAQPHYRSDPNCTDPQWAGGGPYRAVAELDPAVWEWVTVPVNHGLTILRKKSGQILL